MPEMPVVRVKLLEACPAEGPMGVPIGAVHDAMFGLPVGIQTLKREANEVTFVTLEL